MLAVVVSKPVKSGMLRTKVSTDAPSATCLPSSARSEPSASTTTPAKIGSQIRMLRIGQSIASTLKREPADQHGQRDDHRECVVIEIARLEPPRDARHDTYRACAAVHDEPVDQELITDPPEHPAHAARRPCDHVLVDPVEVVLVDE